MAEAAKLMAEIDEAGRRLESLKRSRRNMLDSYNQAIRDGQAVIDRLWSQYRASRTDTSNLPAPPAE